MRAQSQRLHVGRGTAAESLDVERVRADFPILSQEIYGKPLALFNPIGENHPSSSRRFELFAIPAVTYGFPDFAFGDRQAFG